jgi:hypothetical protein
VVVARFIPEPLKKTQLPSAPPPPPLSFPQITFPLESVVSFPLFDKDEQFKFERVIPARVEVALDTVRGPVIEIVEPLNVEAVIVEPDMLVKSTLELPEEIVVRGVLLIASTALRMFCRFLSS